MILTSILDVELRLREKMLMELVGLSKAARCEVTL